MRIIFWRTHFSIFVFASHRRIRKNKSGTSFILGEKCCLHLCWGLLSLPFPFWGLFRYCQENRSRLTFDSLVVFATACVFVLVFLFSCVREFVFKVTQAVAKEKLKLKVHRRRRTCNFPHKLTVKKGSIRRDGKESILPPRNFLVNLSCNYICQLFCHCLRFFFFCSLITIIINQKLVKQIKIFHVFSINCVEVQYKKN